MAVGRYGNRGVPAVLPAQEVYSVEPELATIPLPSMAERTVKEMTYRRNLATEIPAQVQFSLLIRLC